MWTTYSEISSNFFKNATFLVDKYHWIRQVIWAFEAVRKETQKQLKPDVRKYFKRSRSLLIKRYEYLSPEDKLSVNNMLWYSPKISEAHSIKEWFFAILANDNVAEAKKDLITWLNSVNTSDLQPFKRCVSTFFNWKRGIINSFDAPYTNGFTEGCNNKIKVLKRNAYGYRRFDRFRNRILHIFSHQNAA